MVATASEEDETGNARVALRHGPRMEQALVSLLASDGYYAVSPLPPNPVIDGAAFEALAQCWSHLRAEGRSPQWLYPPEIDRSPALEDYSIHFAPVGESWVVLFAPRSLAIDDRSLVYDVGHYRNGQIQLAPLPLSFCAFEKGAPNPVVLLSLEEVFERFPATRPPSGRLIPTEGLSD